MAKYTIQYRQLKTEGLPPGLSLKGMIVDAMRAERSGTQIGLKAKSRIIDIDQDNSFVILNKITEPEAWDSQVFSGQLIHLQSGTNVAAVLQSLEEDTDEFLLEQINLGEQARVLKGILYFAAVDCHVGLIEGQQVRGRTLERYLTSLLQSVGRIEPGQAILLNAVFRSGDGKELSEASEFVVQAERNASDGKPPTTAAGRVIEEEVARLQREGATVFDVLRTLGWDDTAIERLSAEIPEEGWIEGAFKVFIKSRGKRKNISRATINEALRNIDPADIGLNGEGRERGGIVKLSTVRDIKTEGSLKDPQDAIEQIVNALREWAITGKIDCVFDS